MIEEKKFIEVELGLSLAEAEGNLRFLSQVEMKTFTQGEAVLDALHAVQKARKELQAIRHAKRIARKDLQELIKSLD